MFTNPETRMQQRNKASKKLNQLFDELDLTSDEAAKNVIKREIRKVAAENGIARVKFPKEHQTDDDLVVLKESLRKKLKK